jgi:hypothetical protein
MSAITFALEHVDDLPGGVIAEELAQRLLVPGDSVAFDKLQKVSGLIERQRGLGEVGIGRDEVLRRAMDIGEVATASAGDENFSARLRVVFEEKDATVALSGYCGAHETGCACTQHDYVEFGDLRHFNHCRRME